MATERAEIGTLSGTNCTDTLKLVAVLTAVRKCRRAIEVDLLPNGQIVFRAHWPIKRKADPEAADDGE